MIWVGIVAVTLQFTVPGEVVEPVPGDALGLLPPPVAGPRHPGAGSPEPVPDPSHPQMPPNSAPFTSPWAWATALMALGWGTWRSRRWRGQLQATAPPGILVVLVGGFGTAPGEGFEDLVQLMGLRTEQVYSFDWRRARDVADPSRASREATIDDAADALGGYLDGLATHGRPIYVIGHSKGGAAIAELLARWDDHPGAAQRKVVGAMLLDPPLDDGIWGGFQSAGRFFPLIPNDGGYEPLHCGIFHCEDDRENLGLRAGVEVVVIRNRDAWVTNFDDDPAGMRIYDFDDGGFSARTLAIRNPVASWRRVVDAHMSVLHSEAVAACAVAELWQAGGCDWED